MKAELRARVVRRGIGALAFLSVGGTTLAAIALAAQPRHAAEATAARHIASAVPVRIAVPPAELRQAYAAGTIDRPIKSILNVTARMNYGDYRWDEQGVPAGPAWIRVDLKSQIISIFRSGHEIGTAVILYGADGVPTPTGKFPILAKMKEHRSATYDAPMPYTLRLTRDGVSIHANNVRWGYATHGCIGVPAAFAAKLFDAASIGDEVLITRAG
jgi:hypothetical protein